MIDYLIFEVTNYKKLFKVIELNKHIMKISKDKLGNIRLFFFSFKIILKYLIINQNSMEIIKMVMVSSKFCVLIGITRGCGRQKIGAFINLGAYYFVGIPMAIFLAFFQGIGGKVV